MPAAACRSRPRPRRAQLGLADYCNVVSDPTPDTMERYLRVGEHECWRKMPMLATRLRIAHALQALQAALTERAAASAMDRRSCGGRLRETRRMTKHGAHGDAEPRRKVESALSF